MAQTLTPEILRYHVQDHLMDASACPHGEVCFKALDPDEYAGLVQVVNGNNHRELSNRLARLGNHDLCIMTVGSDGKQERHSQSRAELAIVHTGALRFDPQLEIARALHEDVTNYNLEATEVRRLDEPELVLSYAFGNPNSVYPDRLLNSSFVVGNRDIWLRTRRQVLSEMSGESSVSARIRRHLRKQVQLYRQALERGTYAGHTIFNQEDGVMFYDEDPLHYRVAIKMSHLRLVQRHLDRLVAHGLVNNNLTIEQTSAELPAETTVRIAYLADAGLIKEGVDAGELIYGYEWCLQQYHLCQQRFKQRRTLSEVHFDKEVFASISELLYNFSVMSR